MYNNFFRDIELFLTKYNLSKSDDLKGMDDREIKELETLLDKTFGSALKSFFSFFGKKISVQGEYSISINFSKTSLLYAHNESSLNDRKIYTEISNIKYIELDKNIKLLNSLNDVILIDYYEYSNTYTLIREKEDNPLVYHYYGLGDLVRSHCKFTDYIRLAIFRQVISLIKTNNLSIDNVVNFKQLLEEKWVAFYVSRLEDRKFWYNYYENRYIFHELMYESDKTKDSVLSINEWENLFIEYLKD